MCDLEMFWARCSETQPLSEAQQITVEKWMLSHTRLCESEDLTHEICHRKKIYLQSFQEGGKADTHGLFFFWLGKGLLTFPFTACRKLTAEGSGKANLVMTQMHGEGVQRYSVEQRSQFFSERNIEQKNLNDFENTSVKRSSEAQGS